MSQKKFFVNIDGEKSPEIGSEGNVLFYRETNGVVEEVKFASSTGSLEFGLDIPESKFESVFNESRALFEKEVSELEEISAKKELMTLNLKQVKGTTAEFSSDKYPNWTFQLRKEHSVGGYFTDLKSRFDNPVIKDGICSHLYITRVNPEDTIVETSYLKPYDDLAVTDLAPELEELRVALNENRPVKVKIADILPDRINLEYKGIYGVIWFSELYYSPTYPDNLDYYRSKIGEEIDLYVYIVDENGNVSYSECQIQCGHKGKVNVNDFNHQIGDLIECIPFKYENRTINGRVSKGIYVLYNGVSLFIPADVIKDYEWSQVRELVPLGKPVELKVLRINRVPKHSIHLTLPNIKNNSAINREELLMQTTTESLSDSLKEGDRCEVKMRVHKFDEKYVWATYGKIRGKIYYNHLPVVLRTKLIPIVLNEMDFPAVVHIVDGKYEFNILEAIVDCIKAQDLIGYPKTALVKIYLYDGQNRKMLCRWSDIFIDYSLNGYEASIYRNLKPMSEIEVSFAPPQYDKKGKLLLKINGLGSDIAKGWSNFSLKRGAIIDIAASGAEVIRENNGSLSVNYKENGYTYPGEIISDTVPKGTPLGSIRNLILLKIDRDDNKLLFGADALSFAYQRNVHQTDGARDYTLEHIIRLGRTSSLVKYGDFYSVLDYDGEYEEDILRYCNQYCSQKMNIGGTLSGFNMENDLAFFKWNGIINGKSYRKFISRSTIMNEAVELLDIINNKLILKYNDLLCESQKIVPAGSCDINILKKGLDSFSFTYTGEYSDSTNRFSIDISESFVERVNSLSSKIIAVNPLINLSNYIEVAKEPCRGAIYLATVNSVESDSVSFKITDKRCGENGRIISIPFEELNLSREDIDNKVYCDIFKPERTQKYLEVRSRNELSGTQYRIAEKNSLDLSKSMVGSTFRCRIQKITDATISLLPPEGYENAGYSWTVSQREWSSDGDKLAKACGYEGCCFNFMVVEVDGSTICLSRKSATKSLEELNNSADCDENWSILSQKISSGERVGWHVVERGESLLYVEACGVVATIGIEEIAKEAGRDITWGLALGDRIDLYVCSFESSNREISLRYKRSEENDCSLNAPSAGEIVECTVTAITGDNMLIVDDGEWCGFVKPKDLVWGILADGELPYPVGSRVRCRVVGQDDSDGRIWWCNIRELLVSGEKIEDIFKSGYLYNFTVDGIDDEKILLSTSYSPSEQDIVFKYRALLPLSECGVTIEELDYSIGDKINAIVTGIDYGSQMLKCSLEELYNFVRLGQIIECEVIEHLPSGILVNYKGLKSSINHTELGWTRYPAALVLQYPVGTTIKAKVKGFLWRSPLLMLNLTELMENPWKEELYTAGESLQGEIILISNTNITITLGNGIIGSIPLNRAFPQLNNYFDPGEYYKVGQRLDCKVVSYIPEKYDLTCAVDTDFKSLLEQSSLKVNDIVKAEIVSKKARRAVLQYKGLRGEISLDELYWIAPYNNEIHYEVGEWIEVGCKSIIEETGRIIFSVKLGQPAVYENIVVKKILNIPDEKICGLIVGIDGYDAFMEIAPGHSWIFKENERVTARAVAISDETADIRYRLMLSKNSGYEGSISEGDIVEALVRRTDPKGLVVDIDGLVAFINLTNISWFAAERDPHKYKVGESVRCQCVGVDKLSGICHFSIKALEKDPMEGVVESSSGIFRIGSFDENWASGILTLEAEGGDKRTVRAIAYYYELDWRFSRYKAIDPTHLYSVGDELVVKVLSINRDLGMVRVSARDNDPDFRSLQLAGSEIKAKVLLYDSENHCYIVGWESNLGTLDMAESSFQYWEKGEIGYRYTPLIVGHIPGEEISLLVKESYHIKQKRITALPSLTFTGSKQNVDPFADKKLLPKKGDIIDVKIIGFNHFADEEIAEKSSDIFGAIVDIGLGIRGYIPLQILYRKHSDYLNGYHIGDTIKVEVGDEFSKFPALTPYLDATSEDELSVGSTYEVEMLSRERKGFNVIIKECGRLGWIPAQQLSHKSTDNTDCFEWSAGESRVAKIIKNIRYPVLSLSEALPLENLYQMNEVVKGTILSYRIEGKNNLEYYIVELEKAYGRVYANNLSWPKADGENPAVEIGKEYNFHVIGSQRDGKYLYLSALKLEEYPFKDGGFKSIERGRVFKLTTRYALVDVRNFIVNVKLNSTNRNRLIVGNEVELKLETIDLKETKIVAKMVE